MERDLEAGGRGLVCVLGGTRLLRGRLGVDGLPLSLAGFDDRTEADWLSSAVVEHREWRFGGEDGWRRILSSSRCRRQAGAAVRLSR